MLTRLAIRFLRWHAIKHQTGCPHCGKPITPTSTWAEIRGDIYHGDCILETTPKELARLLAPHLARISARRG